MKIPDYPPVATATDGAAMASRCARLRPEADDAQRLLYHAAAANVAIDAAISDPILSVLTALDDGMPTQQMEAAFLQAYQQLAAKLAPVTAASLRASATRIPQLLDLAGNRPRFLADLREMTLGRFVHFVAFTFALLCTGAVIAYQTIGESALARYDAAGKKLEQLSEQHRVAKSLLRERQGSLNALLERKGSAEAIAGADRQLTESIDQVRLLEDAQRELLDERAQLPNTVAVWVGQPCKPALISWICNFSVAPAAGSLPPREVLFDAQMALKRLNVVVLPMLLGFLGAYSFVLRSISLDIKRRAFEPSSFLHHVVRLSLGALAGIAAGWMLEPQQIGLLDSVPAWVMAFVAGYGIELVFAVLDRMVATFAAPPAK